MKLLLIAPELGMADATAAALQIQQSGNEVYPLLGTVTEAQIADQCRPENGYEACVWLCHGAPDGLTLGAVPSLDPMRPALVLGTEQVAAYMQAAGSLRLVMLAACEGQNTAAQVALATEATVIYAMGALLTARAVTACATVVRTLKRGMAAARKVALVQGLRVYAGEEGGEVNGEERAINQMGTLISAHLDALRRDMRAMEERLSGRIDGVEAKVDSLKAVSMVYTGKKRTSWLIGFLLFALPCFLFIKENRDLLGLEPTAAVLVIALVWAVACGFLMYGMGLVRDL
jgi:hypothetical protein